MVLNSVIGPTRKKSGNGGPFVTEAGMGPDNGIVLFGCKSPVLNLRGELITPPETAGFAGSTRDGFADEGPVSWAVFLD